MSTGSARNENPGEDRRPGELRAFYRSGDPISIARPPDAARVLARHVTGRVVDAELGAHARFGELPPGTYAVRAYGDGGHLTYEEMTTVGADPGERPVHGFATSFQDQDVAEVIAWHRALRSTIVQVYDWMASYTAPLGSAGGWQDPSHRPVQLTALRHLTTDLHYLGAVAHAYAPIYAAGNEFADAHPDLMMYREDGQVFRFLDQIVLADPGNIAWQAHFIDAYGAAADAIGFDGFHIDTYGYPRLARTRDGRHIDMPSAYESFLARLRAARPTALISFNQVNGVPAAAKLPPGPGFRYCEVWPPNSEWRHLEGLLNRSSGTTQPVPAGGPPPTRLRGSIACYPPVWGADPTGRPADHILRDDPLRTVVYTEAIATLLGASALLYGDRTAVLSDPYYPKHASLTTTETRTVLAWRRFALQCRDLFLDGEDTSWYELGDENGTVAAQADAPISPEPDGGGLFARVVHAEGRVSIGVVDLTGNSTGRWSEPTRRGTPRTVRLRILLERPDHWQAQAAVLGAHHDHFTTLPTREVSHRQGRALQIDLPMIDGWSVLTIARTDNPTLQ